MRALLTFALLTGFIMTAADNKKRDPNKDESYDEVVTLRKWNPSSKNHIAPVEGIRAYRLTGKDGALRFWVKAQPGDNANPNEKSELTDKDGSVFVAETVSLGNLSGFHVVTVKPKPK